MARAAVLACLVLAALASTAGAETSDRYLEGYVTAAVERDLGVKARVQVEDGHARVTVERLDGRLPERIADLVSRIDGIESVEVRDADAEILASEQGAADGEDEDAGGGIEFLPRFELFEPLLADPREPHFSAIYQRYIGDSELENVGSANFGETFPLLGGELGDGRWELGLLGAVFSVFDLDAASSDLVNSDFWVGPTISVRRGGLSAQMRIYHQSSHLGDEFLLRNRVDRVNLSYEGVDLLVSAEPFSAVRVYGGGGVIVHDEPDLHPLSVQGGIEVRSPIAFLDDLVRPLAAFDFQAREENDWNSEIGAVAGIELSNPDVLGMRLMILGSYFQGNSPNGQFFERRIEYLGVGAHLFF